jgi:hypothetical protein
MRKVMLVFGCSLVLLFGSAGAVPQGLPMSSAALASDEIINHGGKIETKYDGFNHETVMRLRKMKVTCTGFKDSFKDGCVSIDVTLHCPGVQLNYVGSVTLQLVFETKDWSQAHPWDQRELSVVTDGSTLRFGRMTLVPKGDTLMAETMVETLEVTFPYKFFKKIALSQSVEIQLGKSIVELREKNRVALRDLNSRVMSTP